VNGPRTDFAGRPPWPSSLDSHALDSCHQAWPRDHFLLAWQDALPPAWGLSPEPSQLDGLAIVLTQADDVKLEEDVLQALPLASLPLTPKERFTALFKVKRAWAIDELAPYVRDMLDPGRSAESLVLQYGRSVVANDGSVKYVTRY